MSWRPPRVSCFKNILKRWLLVVHSRKILEILSLLLLGELNVDSVELLLESYHTTIKIGINLLFLSDNNTFGTLTTCTSFSTAISLSCTHYLILIEIWHNLGLILSTIVFDARWLLTLLTLSCWLLTFRELSILIYNFFACSCLLVRYKNFPIVIGASNNHSTARISIIKEGLLFHRWYSNLSLLLLPTASMSCVSSSIISHNATFFAYIAEVMRLISAHMKSSRILCRELICTALIGLILIRFAILKLRLRLILLHIGVVFLIQTHIGIYHWNLLGNLVDALRWPLICYRLRPFVNQLQVLLQKWTLATKVLQLLLLLQIIIKLSVILLLIAYNYGIAHILTRSECGISPRLIFINN